MIEASAHNGNEEQLSQYRNYQLICVLIIFVGIAWLFSDLERVYMTGNIGIFSVLVPLVGIYVSYHMMMNLKNKIGVLDAGMNGEKIVADVLSELSDEYVVLNNVPLNVDGSQTEIDSLVVSKYGLWIFEVKNYTGFIDGECENNTWTRTKISSNGNPYTNEIKNPLKQMHRQIAILRSILSQIEEKAYINGAVVLPNIEGIDVNCDKIIVQRRILLDTIKQQKKVVLNQKRIDGILDALTVNN